jgi:hypothetical protein
VRDSAGSGYGLKEGLFEHSDDSLGSINIIVHIFSFKCEIALFIL